MPQIFHRSTNTISRASIIVLLIVVSAALWSFELLQRSPFFSWRGVAREQPVPFSHAHHVAGLGLDCRYCHVSVEVSNFAGIPPTKTCMNCHSQIWTNAPMLEPVRESFRTGRSLQWTRVNSLPDFVYFDHSIHVNKGVGCKSCHGPVDRMPLMLAENTLQMEWCLNCHRAPEKELRPRNDVFDMTYEQPSTSHPVVVNGEKFTDQLALGTYLKKQYHVRSVNDITSCNTCHR
ncbi:MAG TPA: cytochrome c3 family protein [Terriglobales bacterium]|nr:cytochrome c3 family protein [Terriglobales bacterium]